MKSHNYNILQPLCPIQFLFLAIKSQLQLISLYPTIPKNPREISLYPIEIIILDGVITICLASTSLVGGWATPLKNISQLGWLFPIYGQIKYVPNHQPVVEIPWFLPQHLPQLGLRPWLAHGLPIRLLPPQSPGAGWDLTAGSRLMSAGSRVV